MPSISRCAQTDPVDFSELFASVSLIDEQNGRRLRMGHLAFVGSHRVNGVSALHTDLMRNTVFRDLHALYPDRIVNKTNGITFRRWLMQANPGLVQLLREVCGDAVLDDPSLIARLADHADDSALHARVAAVKRANKVAFSRLIYDRMGCASIQMRCSTCRSSASTNTSGSCSTSWKRSRSIARYAMTRRAIGSRA